MMSAAFSVRAAFVFVRRSRPDDVLGFVDRGSYTVLSAYPGKRLEKIIRLTRSIFVRSARSLPPISVSRCVSGS